ncbi:MAG: hypothetical protein SW833_08430 [Cyanobacteriota bacterium]|nr:hypothetical protein [Cyanobacteriota bacterium]
MTEIVEKGDWIEIDPAFKENATIKWQQDLGNRQEPYIVYPYSVQGKQASGSLFIQLGLKKAFFSKCKVEDSDIVPGDKEYKIQVNDDFQYGQNNEKSLRFLVYHNKSNKPYQHRFIETTAFSNIGNKIVEMGAASAPAWGALIGKGADLAKGFIGDYLRDF